MYDPKGYIKFKRNQVHEKLNVRVCSEANIQ